MFYRTVLRTRLKKPTALNLRPARRVGVNVKAEETWVLSGVQNFKNPSVGNPCPPLRPQQGAAVPCLSPAAAITGALLLQGAGQARCCYVRGLELAAALFGARRTGAGRLSATRNAHLQASAPASFFFAPANARWCWCWAAVVGGVRPPAAPTKAKGPCPPPGPAHRPAQPREQSARENRRHQ